MAIAKRYGFDPFKTPWNEMTPQAQQAFLFGDAEPLTITYESRTGRSTTRTGQFPGFYGFIRDWDVGNTYSENIPCPDCGGARLRPEYLAVKLAGKDVHQLSQLTLIELAHVTQGITLHRDQERLAGHSLKAIQERLEFLNKVGLGYLNLDRPTGTLSAGEIQRIRLASLLGSGLTSLTILLDEPTRGLHPREVQALVDAMHHLRAVGNTVIVVEHDPLVMRSADYLVDVGPGSGEMGGRIVACGRPDEVAQGNGLTAAWLRGEKKPIFQLPRRKPDRWMSILGARENNLKGERVKIPLGVVCGICGVSGSGKSTLIMDTLGRALAPRKMTTSVAYEPIDPGIHEAILGAPKRVILVDQVKASASSPVNALGLADPLRAIFAESEDAISLDLSVEDLASKCSACGGSGLISLDMGFLPDSTGPCEVCRGTGFLPEAWEVKVNGRCLPDVYRMSLAEVYDLFKDDERVVKALQAACDVGLGYLRLRQPGLSLSGGEMQRLKIADELYKGAAQGTLYILDEPTVGQHLEDVQRLAQVLHRLVDDGGSVIVVEHHPHLLAACDWLVELGPEGGPQGGHIIANGTPEELAAGTTPTAKYIHEILEGTL
jgi:excinuclease ABC subunit A